MKGILVNFIFLTVLTTVHCEVFDLSDLFHNPVIVHPCDVRDIDCISSFFEDRAECTKDLGPASDTLMLKTHTSYAPAFNMSFLQRPVTITNLNSARVLAFYFNTATRRAVLSLVFRNLRMFGTTFFRKHLVAREPREIISHTNEIFPCIVTTTVFSSYLDMDLKNSETSTVVHESVVFDLGDEITKSEDEYTVNLFANAHSSAVIANREAFLSRGRLLASNFIQNHFCNYGLDYDYQQC